MNLFQILESLCTDDIKVVVGGVKSVMTLIQWAIPCVLIVLGTIDMFKAMTSGDEKVTKESQKKFIKRLIYAAVAFLIPFIIKLGFTLVGNFIKTGEAQDASNAFYNFMICWSEADSVTTESKVCKDEKGYTTRPVDGKCPQGYTMQ